MLSILVHLTGLFPNVALPGTEQPDQTQLMNLFIYRWPAQEQQRYPGTVTVIKYCYQGRTNGTQEPLFTLHLLFNKTSTSDLRVAQTIPVTTENASSTCCSRSAMCCSRQQLNTRQWFQVPSAYSAFGITTNRQGGILAFRPGQGRNTLGFQIAANRIQNGTIVVTPQEARIINYRLFNFVIGKGIQARLFSNLSTCDSFSLNNICFLQIQLIVQR